MAFKHLIVLVDGTWNSAARGSFRDTTNIFRLNHALDTHDNDKNPQITFYMPGPGTRGWTDKSLGGIFGIGIDQIVKEAYVNLASNYDSRDKIYLFGFSRGAVVARALSGLISKCGLLFPRSIHLFWKVWDYFLHPERYPDFHNEISPYVNDNVKVELLGVFDTVLGRSYTESNIVTKLRFKDYKLDSLVRRGIQILAIDDNRSRFRPIIWDGSNETRQRTGAELSAARDRIEQIWLPGVHADIGGIISKGDNSTNFLSNVSFLTMIERIRRHSDLAIDESYVREILDSLRYINKIAISNERESQYMRALGYRQRKFGAEMFGREKRIGEYVHPIYDFIKGRKIYVRGSLKSYNNPFLETNNELPNRFQTEYKSIYKEQCDRIIDEFHS